MAHHIICGFETGNSNEAYLTTGTFSIQGTTTRGAWSSYALRVNPTTTAIGHVRIRARNASGYQALGAMDANVGYVRFYLRVATAPASASEELCVCQQTDGNNKLSVRINSTRTLSLYTGAGGDCTTLLADGATVLSLDTWYRIEFKVGKGASAVVELKINGTSEISTTSSNVGSGGFTGIWVGKSFNANSQSIDLYYDDLAVSDSAYPGDGKVSRIGPNANGNYQTWSIGAGSGSHYEIVDEVPHDSDTTYLLGATTGLPAAETEALVSTLTGTINAVLGYVIVRQNIAIGSMAVRLRSGSTDSDTNYADLSNAMSYTMVGKMFNTDPATGSAWLAAALDSIEVGALTNDVNFPAIMTAVGAMVDYTPAAAAPKGGLGLMGMF